MNEIDAFDLDSVLTRIYTQAKEKKIRITLHAQKEMTDEEFTLDEVLDAITTSQILENYPNHRREACCLLNGLSKEGRPVHIVCTTVHPVLIIITVYEPKPPKWKKPTQRRK